MDAREFNSDVFVDPRFIGMGVICPFLANISTQRAAMMFSNLQQAVVIDGAEIAKIQSGYENKFGKYDFNYNELDQPVTIVEVIPKFRTDNFSGIKMNPRTTVIYVGCEDNKLGYFDIDSYTELSGGFGFLNNKLNSHYVSKGQCIPKNTKFTSSPNYEDEMYKIGVNAKVCYLPIFAATNDSFIISERLRDKCKHTVINSITLNITKDMVPLNLYGDTEMYKIFPDIGDKVREDGLVIGFRAHNPSSILSDMTIDSLMYPEHLHDDLPVIPVGSEIIDIEIFTNHSERPNLNSEMYQQLEKYQSQYDQYWSRIIEVYEHYKALGYTCTSAMNNLVTNCKGWCYTNKVGRSMILMDKKEEVDFVNLKITYAFERNISRGYKLTGRDGAKGVVADVWKTEDMPHYEDGTTADICIPGDSPFNRLNGGQYYEQAINACSELIQKRIINNTWMQDYQEHIKFYNYPINSAYEYILEYINTVRPVYAKLVREQTEGMEQEYVNDVKEEGIYFIIPPYCKSINTDLLVTLADKYGLKRQIVKYTVYNGDKPIEITSKYPCLIGDKYLYLLGKIPIDQVNCVEYNGYVNQTYMPIKPGSKIAKYQSLIRLTPNKYGEDETSALTMSVGAEETVRFLNIYSNSPTAQRKLENILLTIDKPSCVRNINMSNKEIFDNSVVISLLTHQLASIGYELRDATEEEISDQDRINAELQNDL